MLILLIFGEYEIMLLVLVCCMVCDIFNLCLVMMLNGGYYYMIDNVFVYFDYLK